LAASEFAGAILLAGAIFPAGAIRSEWAEGWVDWAIDGVEASRPSASAAAVIEASVK
jgi:hypothetical protein